MLEKHRLIYLDALGIDNYMPRFTLLSALPSQLLPDEALIEPTAFSTADNPVVDSIEQPMSNSIATPSKQEAQKEIPAPVLDELLGNALTDNSKQEREQQLHYLAEDKPSNAAIVSAAALIEAVQNKATNTPTEIRFALNAWRVSNDILVLDSRQPGAALPTDRLLQNILRSIGCHLVQLPQSEILRWPLFKDDFGSHPEDEARAMVQAYISAQSNKSPFKILLLFGKDAVRFSLVIEQSIEEFFANQQGTALKQEQWQSQVLICPSLIDMLQEPTQKKVTWQALQSVTFPS